MKTIRGLSIGLHFFVGLGGMAGGLGAVLNPQAPMGMSTETLRNGPFRDFLIPGLFLMGVIGLCNLIAGLIAIRKPRYYGLSSGAMALVLMAWIVIQCWILQDIVALHVIFFLFGAVQGCLAFAACWGENIFPARFFRKWFGGPGEKDSW